MKERYSQMTALQSSEVVNKMTMIATFHLTWQTSSVMEIQCLCRPCKKMLMTHKYLRANVQIVPIAEKTPRSTLLRNRRLSKIFRICLSPNNLLKCVYLTIPSTTWKCQRSQRVDTMSYQDLIRKHVSVRKQPPPLRLTKNNPVSS